MKMFYIQVYFDLDGDEFIRGVDEKIFYFKSLVWVCFEREFFKIVWYKFLNVSISFRL